MKHSEEKQYTQSSDPENFIPKFRRRNLDKTGFLNKLARFAGRLRGVTNRPARCTSPNPAGHLRRYWPWRPSEGPAGGAVPLRYRCGA